MVRENEIRKNELVVDAPVPTDAALVFIGRISTPWTSRMETPRQGRHDGPMCRIEIFEPWVAALQGVDAKSGPQPQGTRDFFLALTGSPEPDRHVHRQA
jgi:hypothetical protein